MNLDKKLAEAASMSLFIIMGIESKLYHGPLNQIAHDYGGPFSMTAILYMGNKLVGGPLSDKPLANAAIMATMGCAHELSELAGLCPGGVYDWKDYFAYAAGALFVYGFDKLVLENKDKTKKSI